MNKLIYFVFICFSFNVFSKHYRPRDYECGKYRISGKLSGPDIIVYRGTRKQPSKTSYRISLFQPSDSIKLNYTDFITVIGTIDSLPENRDNLILKVIQMKDDDFSNDSKVELLEKTKCLY